MAITRVHRDEYNRRLAQVHEEQKSLWEETLQEIARGIPPRETDTIHLPQCKLNEDTIDDLLMQSLLKSFVDSLYSPSISADQAISMYNTISSVSDQELRDQYHVNEMFQDLIRNKMSQNLKEYQRPTRNVMEEMEDFDDYGWTAARRSVNTGLMGAFKEKVEQQSDRLQQKITKLGTKYNKWVILFPGSFNPVHHGHMCLAGDILRMYGADELWMMPTPQNPLKGKKGYADKWQRYVMIEKMSEYYGRHHGETYKKIKPSYFEFTLKAPFYTAKTIQALQKIYPNYYFSLLIGTDNLAIFDKWKKYKWLYDNIHIIAFGRLDGSDFKALREKYPKVDLYEPKDFYDISSTQIRTDIPKGDYSSVHCSIVDYIKENKLYK